MYLLDTDTCIYLLNRKDLLIEHRLKGLKKDEVGLSTITVAELAYGAAHSQKMEANEKKVRIFSSALTQIPFDEEAAWLFGQTKEDLASKGIMIGIMDLLIASVALAQKAVLITHNTKEFGRVPHLRIEDWFETA